MKYLLLSLFLTSAYAGTVQDTNKKLVTEFYEMSFNRHQPREAAAKYIGKEYIQHNPYVANGTEPFVTYFEGYFKTNKESSAEIKRSMADGDLVMLHVLSKQKKTDRGQAVIDIFRVKDGKIVEHWDVIQPVPEKTASGNSMF